MTKKHCMCRKSGVTILEYAVLIVALVAGIVMAQKYMIRAVEFKWREAGDVFGYGRQLKTEGTTSTTVSHVYR